MAVEQVAHRFVTFLVEKITTKVGQIEKETQSETTRFVADEVKSHCEELQKAVDALFNTEAEPSASTNVRRGGRNGKGE